MCGLAGILRGDGGSVDPATLLHMADRLAHRGPDGAGFLRLDMRTGRSRSDLDAVDGHFDLGLAFRRLAILDLTAQGTQPMAGAEDGLWLVFNGEIYNEAELKRDCARPGRRYRSRTDSEAILAAYERLGPEAVARLNGMFALGLWDQRRRRLLLARDRLGIKPLYWAAAGGALAFASEIKALFAAGLPAPGLDPRGLAEHFTFSFNLGERTLFRDVHRLEPGTMLLWQDGRFRSERYWQPRSRPRPGSLAAHAGDLLEAVDGAVGRQLRSDVPVGTYLSGGMDTGAVAALAARRLGRLHSFTGGFDTAGLEGQEAGFDERGESLALAERLGTDHHVLEVVPGDLERLLPAVAWHLEEPRAGISYQVLAVAAEVARHVTVVLSGVGGDELFAGYPWRYERVAGLEGAAFADAYYGIWSRLLDDDGRRRLFADPLLADLQDWTPRRGFDALLARSDSVDPLERALEFDLGAFLPALLGVDDKLHMAVSVEARVPLLDNEVVDLALAIPAGLKFHGGEGKRVLRRALAGLLPAEHLGRRKQGFTPPDASWYRGPSRGTVEGLLMGERFLDRGLVKPTALRALLDDHMAGRTNCRFLIWSLMLLEWTCRLHLDDDPPPTRKHHWEQGRTRAAPVT